MPADFDRARTLFLDGLAHFEAGRLDAAERAFLESLRHLPDRPSTLLNLAAVRIRLGRPAEALTALDAALAQTPDDADAHFSRGQTLQALGRPLDALDAYARVTALDPQAAPAWTQRGAILKDMGRHAEAADCFRQALDRGGDRELNQYYLASVGGSASEDAAVPQAAPRAYVEALFDGYAEEFDRHLVGKLGYRTPQLLAALLPPERRFASALDLGCGTGLMAPLLAPRCAVLDGLDLSSQMLAKARALGLYRELHHADVVEHLSATPERHDLVAAADVFVYVGALDATFAGVARVLAPGGLFLFSVEEADPGHELQLRTSSRYAHGLEGLRRLAAAHGFVERRLERATLRHDQQRPIGGLCLLLERVVAA